MDHNDIAREQRRRETQSWLNRFEAELHVQTEFVEKVFEKLHGYAAKATIQYQRVRGRTHHVAFFDWEASTNEAPWALRLHMPISFDQNIREKRFPIRYLQEHSDIPVPRLLAWGVEDGPYDLSWSIDYQVQNAISLCRVVEDLTAAEKQSLLDDLDAVTVKFSKLRFSRIGALSVASDSQGKHTFHVTERPWCMALDDNVLDGADLRAALPPGKTFDKSNDYIDALVEAHMLVYSTLRHAAQASRREDEVWTQEEWEADLRDDANFKLRIRLMLKLHLADWKARNSDTWQPTFCLTHGDFTRGNVLVDRDTHKFAAIIDFEFCRVEPVAFLNPFTMEKFDCERMVADSAWEQFLIRRNQLSQKIAQSQLSDFDASLEDLKTRLAVQSKYDYFFQYTVQRVSDLEYIMEDFLGDDWEASGSYIKEDQLSPAQVELVERKVAERKTYEMERAKVLRASCIAVP